VNKKKDAKSAQRKSVKLKLARRFETATERMAFRLTTEQKAKIQEAAIADGRTDSNYIREVMLKHLASIAPFEK
jgi:predicted DNA-binding protein